MARESKGMRPIDLMSAGGVVAICIFLLGWGHTVSEETMVLLLVSLTGGIAP